MVWYSHLFQNFPEFIVIYTVEGFGIVNKAEIDVFLDKEGLILTTGLMTVTGEGGYKIIAGLLELCVKQQSAGFEGEPEGFLCK